MDPRPWSFEIKRGRGRGEVEKVRERGRSEKGREGARDIWSHRYVYMTHITVCVHVDDQLLIFKFEAASFGCAIEQLFAAACRRSRV